MHFSKLRYSCIFLSVLWLGMSAGGRASALGDHWAHSAIVMQIPEGLQISDQLVNYLPTDCIEPLSIRPLKMLSAVTASSGFMNALNQSSQEIMALYYQMDEMNFLIAKEVPLPSSINQDNHQLLIERQGVDGVDQAGVILTKYSTCQLSAAKIHVDENSVIDTHLVTGCEKGGEEDSQPCLHSVFSRRVIGTVPIYVCVFQDGPNPWCYSHVILDKSADEPPEYQFLYVNLYEDAKPVPVFICRSSNHDDPLVCGNSIPPDLPPVNENSPVFSAVISLGPGSSIISVNGNLFNQTAPSALSIHSFLIYQAFNDGLVYSSGSRTLNFQRNNQNVFFDPESTSEYISYHFGGHVCLGKLAEFPDDRYSYMNQTEFKNCSISVSPDDNGKRVHRYIQLPVGQINKGVYEVLGYVLVDVIDDPTGSHQLYAVDLLTQKVRELEDEFPDIKAVNPEGYELSLVDHTVLLTETPSHSFLVIFRTKNKYGGIENPIQLRLAFPKGKDGPQGVNWGVAVGVPLGVITTVVVGFLVVYGIYHKTKNRRYQSIQ